MEVRQFKSMGLCTSSMTELYIWGSLRSLNQIIFMSKRISKYNKEDSQRNNKDSRRNDQYTLFTVDVAKMPNNIRFYGDPGSYTGVWTNDNVPPNCIVDVEHYEFEYDKSDGGVKIINRK